jgi:hypothetical protein
LCQASEWVGPAVDWTLVIGELCVVSNKGQAGNAAGVSSGWEE